MMLTCDDEMIIWIYEKDENKNDKIDLNKYSYGGWASPPTKQKLKKMWCVEVRKTNSCDCSRDV